MRAFLAIPVDRSLHCLPRIHRRWILVNAIAGTAVINLILNAGIAWLSAIGLTRVPLWAPPIRARLPTRSAPSFSSRSLPTRWWLRQFTATYAADV